MSPIVIEIAACILAAIVIGLLLGSFLYKRKLARRKGEFEEKSQLIIKEAEIAAESAAEAISIKNRNSNNANRLSAKNSRASNVRKANWTISAPT